MTDEAGAFDDFVVARGPALLRFAYLLTGDRALAEDLVQEALIKAYRRWDTHGRAQHPEAYVRRVVLNEHIAADADDIVGARVDDSGVVRDPSGFAITNSNDLETEPAVAAGIANRWEVAYVRFAPERIYGADRVFHRRIVTN